MKPSTRYAAVLIALLLVAAVAIGQTGEPTHRVTDAVGATLDVVLPITVDTIPATTTTTEPTTTTTEPTTTTTAPTTTTTLPTPTGERYVVQLNGSLLDGTNVSLWDAPYFRNLPYTAGFGWDDGDRVGYKCAYGPLNELGATGRDDDVVMGRFWATNFDVEVGYAVVFDKFMESAIRYFDGTLHTGTAIQLNDCPPATVAYEPITGPSETIEIRYVRGDGALLEVRSYPPAEHHPDVTFHLVEHITEPFTAVGALGQDPHTVYERATVVATFDRGDGARNPAIVFYYDWLQPTGGLEVTSS